MSKGVANMASLLLVWPLLVGAAGGREGRRGQPEIVCEDVVDIVGFRRALSQAAAMLPRAPARIAVMDVAKAPPAVRSYLVTLDAFTVPGNPWIYVIQQSELLQAARHGSQIHVAVLAIVLWHEMAHQAGASERDAREAEEAVWKTFIREGIIDSEVGLRYLGRLRRRPDDPPPPWVGRATRSGAELTPRDRPPNQ